MLCNSFYARLGSLGQTMKDLSRYSYEIQKMKSLLYLVYHAEASNQFAEPSSASLRPSNTAPFKEMPQWWKVVGNNVSDLNRSRFQPHTFCFGNKGITARPTCL